MDVGKKKCVFCGRALLPYKNWNVKYRDSHHSCWKRKQTEIACANMLEDYQKENCKNLISLGIVQIKDGGEAGENDS